MQKQKTLGGLGLLDWLFAHLFMKDYLRWVDRFLGAMEAIPIILVLAP
jgi:hypothetical protein